MSSNDDHKYDDELLDDDEELDDNSEELIPVVNPNDDVLEDEEDDDPLEDEDEDEELEDDYEDGRLPIPVSTAGASNGSGGDPSAIVTVAVAPPAPVPEKIDPIPPMVEKKSQPLDESRKLFQRLWTDEDEIELLKGFYEYTSARGGGNVNSSSNSNSHHHYDTALFYDQIKSKLQLDFNKNQLVEKLRRLKKKYRNVLNRIGSGKDFAFKTPHDQATFEISKKIWSNIGNNSIKDGAGPGFDEDDTQINININSSGNASNRSPCLNLNNAVSSGCDGVDEKKGGSSRSRKRSRVKIEEKGVVTADERAVNLGVSGMVEETLRSCLSPMFKELLSNAMSGPCGARGFGGMLSPLPLSFGNSGNLLGGDAVDEKWRKQQIMELEVYSRRLELVQDQVKAVLDELRAAVS